MPITLGTIKAALGPLEQEPGRTAGELATEMIAMSLFGPNAAEDFVAGLIVPGELLTLISLLTAMAKVAPALQEALKQSGMIRKEN